MTAAVRGFHMVTAAVVSVLLNILELQDIKTWEIQGRERFHFVVFRFNIPRCQVLSYCEKNGAKLIFVYISYTLKSKTR